MEKLFVSGTIELAGHISRPRIAAGTTVPGIVLGHGFPDVNQGGRLSARSFPELADRIATEMGWVAMVLQFRGCGDSDGDFSIGGWRDDMVAACRFMRTQPEVRDVWAGGFGSGGSMAICAAAIDPEIRGVAAMGSQADFSDLANHPRRLLEYAREVGIIHTRSFPPSVDSWARELREVSALRAIRQVAPRPVLIMHGSDDEVVPPSDSRLLADAHGSADLRMVEGGGHHLRHDPRAVAILLGWLDRQRAASAAARAE